MARWIDMTDAQKGAHHQKVKAKERASVLAKPAATIAALARIDAEAAEILAEGGRFAEKNAARALDEKTPIFQRLAHLGINPADIGIAV